jgi:hypothetical protein
MILLPRPGRNTHPIKTWLKTSLFMVTIKPMGGLGNFLFQVTAAISYALKNDLEFHIPSHCGPQGPISFSHLFNPSFDPRKDTILIEEKSFRHQDLPFQKEWGDKNIVLSGYWQSYLYFESYISDFQDLFGFQWRSLPGIISIHKRMGDYRKYPDHHPIVPDLYICKGIEYFHSLGYNRFLVFSDEIDECKAAFNSDVFPAYHFEYSEGKSDIDELQIMSGCEGHIIANSTFSWWSAFLNRYPHKVVVAPGERNWFGPLYQHFDLSTLLPKDWVRIGF